MVPFRRTALITVGGQVKIEAILANQDALPAGMYPTLVQVFDPNHAIVFEPRAIVEIPGGAQSPIAIPVVSDEITIESSPRAYRLTATFEQGASAAADTLEFLVAPPLSAPPEKIHLTLIGEHVSLIGWLNQHGIPFARVDRLHEPGIPGEVVLITTSPADSDPSEIFDQLMKRAERGSTLIFLTPEFFRATRYERLASGWRTRHDLDHKAGGRAD